MIDAAIRSIPLSAYKPLRQAILNLSRHHPVRILATLILRRTARVHSGRLSSQLDEIRPLDAPTLSFEAVDSMVMDAVFWFGVRGYEGTVARVWTGLCQRAQSILEVGGNVGLFTVIGGKATTGTYTVVEPVPVIAKTLRANLLRNGLTRVELLQAAVVPGDEARDVTLNLPEEGRDMPVGAHLLDGVEVSGRSTKLHVTVTGLPIRQLAVGRDLIKIDAEGIETALLSDIRPLLVANKPTLLIEVLPEAIRLGELLASLAMEAGYQIHILPEYGSDTIVTVPAAQFTSDLPKRYHSKDVVLSMGPLA